MMLPVLAQASLDGAIIVAILWLACVCAPRIPAAVRAAVWWCAAAKFLFSLLSISPIVLPVLPVAGDDRPHVSPAAVLDHSQKPDVGDAPHTRPRSGGRAGMTLGPTVGTFLIVVWAGGLLVSGAIGVHRWRRTRNLVKRSEPCPAAIERISEDVAAVLRLRHRPGIRLSRETTSPLVAGLLQPVVLLPADRFLGLGEHQQRMGLCHELAHIKRADLWLGCIPALAERLFFFHPLARLAARQYVFWREAACDAAVLRTLQVAPQDYGRLLLELGISRPATSLAAASAPWSSSNLKRRITMLAFPSHVSRRSRWAAAAVVCIALAAMLPLRLGARPARPAAVPTELQPQLQSPPALAPEAELPGTLPAGQERQESKQQPSLNFVVFYDDHHTTMSGSSGDIRRARQFTQPGQLLLWFRHSGREDVVRDRGVIGEIEQLWQDVSRLGEEQGLLGEQQGKLGEKQGELGERQGRLGEEQGTLGERQGELGEQQAALSERQATRQQPKAENDALERKRADLDRRIRDLNQDLARLEAEMRTLDRPMRELDVQMRALDEQMQDLDRKMHDAQDKAEAGMRALIERVIASGLAEVVRPR